ncbi:MAG: ATP-grasp domain-containing protein [Promethearchaeota archaeon]
MNKKVIFSARQNHEVIKQVINKLRSNSEVDFTFHDPTKQFFNLSRMPKAFKEADLFIVKVRNDCSVDLLHFARINGIKCLHDVQTVSTCKNKIALDYALRRIFSQNRSKLSGFSLVQSWNQSAKKLDRFKKWATPKLPIVLKSHYQHDKYNRFNFLVQKIEEMDIFCERYKHFLYYDIYIQKFIECDAVDRKIYVIGDKVFGIKRENPIYLYMRENLPDIDIDIIEREEFEVSEEIRRLAKILSKELNLKIFGFDLIKPVDKDRYYLIDLNDFPGFKGIKNANLILTDYLLDYIKQI